MKIKTQSKCLKCGEICSPEKASSHLLKCTAQLPISTQSRPVDGDFLVRVSGAEQPNLYWMFIALPQNASLGQLDRFLRDIWLECCGHLSEFTIGGHCYMSHAESGGPDQSMKIKTGQVLSPGMEFSYVYDMGSSTDLEFEVIATLPTCSKKEITLLMRNSSPSFACASCKKPSDTICSLCSETTCVDCREDHSCAVSEGDTYMLMPFVNSPRAGICGYTG